MLKRNKVAYDIMLTILKQSLKQSVEELCYGIMVSSTHSLLWSSGLFHSELCMEDQDAGRWIPRLVCVMDDLHLASPRPANILYTSSCHHQNII